MNTLKKLYIEPTSDCNLDCQMCFRHTWFDEDFCDLDFEDYEMVIKSMPSSVETLMFGGMGEPLYHPRIVDMVTSAVGQSVRVELLTNGSLLSEDMMVQLMDAGLSRVWVSMDDIEPNDKTGLGHPDYEEATNRLRQFNILRNKKKSAIELGITFVVTKHNVNQLANLPFFTHKYGISEVNISHIYPSDFESQADSLYQKTLNMSIGSDVYGANRTVINMPYMDFDRPDVKEGVSGLFGKMNFKLQVGGIPVPRRSNHCRFVEEGMTFVRSDGNVAPCMALLHNGKTVLGDIERKVYHHSFGNVKEQSLDQIWSSDAYVAFRERVTSFAFSPCMNCGHCEYTEDNVSDCFGNEEPTCGACLWAEGLLSCP